MKARSLVLVVGLAAAPITALGCGACIEDKVAATYDYAVITQAAAQHHVVVFASVDSWPVGNAVAQAIRRTAASSKGVDPRSVRVSEEPSALSFAFDPATRSPDSVVAEIETRLHVKGVKLTIIRVTG